MRVLEDLQGAFTALLGAEATMTHAMDQVMLTFRSRVAQETTVQGRVDAMRGVDSLFLTHLPAHHPYLAEVARDVICLALWGTTVPFSPHDPLVLAQAYGQQGGASDPPAKLVTRLTTAAMLGNDPVSEFAAELRDELLRRGIPDLWLEADQDQLPVALAQGLFIQAARQGSPSTRQRMKKALPKGMWELLSAD